MGWQLQRERGAHARNGGAAGGGCPLSAGRQPLAAGPAGGSSVRPRAADQCGGAAARRRPTPGWRFGGGRIGGAGQSAAAAAAA